MRISDWSSDVCSSDLQLGAFGVEANARKLWLDLEKRNSAFTERQPYLVKSGKLTRLQAGGFANKGEAESFCASVRKGGQACLEIGRASCRERVCQYGEISVVAGSLKKKKNKKV